LTIGSDANDINPWDTLAHTLRETLGLTGTKLGCKEGDCGSCTVIADGKPILSCLTLTAECNGKSITTIEGLPNPTTGKLHPIQQAFIDNFGFECGFCTPGVIMSAKALLDQKPKATEDDIRMAVSGNMCRCTGYVPIMRSILAAEKSLGGS
jgi:carbon-monoxide dehydrogenase small subunit